MKSATCHHRSSAVIVGILAINLVASGALHGQDKTAPAGAQSNPESPVPVRQPLPFSHKFHTQFLRECKDCHAISSEGWTMNYPPETTCMTCHATVKTESPAIKKLTEYASQKRPVPWVQIYSVPDYVYFSHRTHVEKAKLDCEMCHGPVRERDVLAKEKPTTMAACISCHKEKSAPIGCRTCHDSQG